MCGRDLKGSLLNSYGVTHASRAQRLLSKRCEQRSETNRTAHIFWMVSYLSEADSKVFHSGVGEAMAALVVGSEDEVVVFRDVLVVFSGGVRNWLGRRQHVPRAVDDFLIEHARQSDLPHFTSAGIYDVQYFITKLNRTQFSLMLHCHLPRSVPVRSGHQVSIFDSGSQDPRLLG